MRVISILLASVLSGCAADIPAPGTPTLTIPARQSSSIVSLRHDALWQALDVYLKAEMETGFSGVVLISLAGEPADVRDYSLDERITKDTAFWIGSVAKSITASAILHLQEEGRLSIDDRIDRFFPDAPPDKRAITLAQLMSHSAGMPDRYAASGVTNRDEAARRLLDGPLIQQPGTGATYSNDGYMLLGLIVEIASGRSYEAYVRDTILRPAGMTRTGFWPTNLGLADMAPVAEMPAPALRRPNWGYRGSTGMSSTAEDVARYGRAMLDGRILRTATARNAMAVHVARPEMRDVGLGWFSEAFGGGRLISHSGAESGLQHYAWLYIFEPSQTVVVVLSNAPEDKAAATADGVIARVAAEQRRSIRLNTDAG